MFHQNSLHHIYGFQLPSAQDHLEDISSPRFSHLCKLLCLVKKMRAIEVTNIANYQMYAVRWKRGSHSFHRRWPFYKLSVGELLGR